VLQDQLPKKCKQPAFWHRLKKVNKAGKNALHAPARMDEADGWRKSLTFSHRQCQSTAFCKIQVAVTQMK